MNGKRPRPDAATLNEDPRSAPYPSYSPSGYSHFPVQNPIHPIPTPQLYSPSADVMETDRPYYLNPVLDPPPQSMLSSSQGGNFIGQNGNSWEYDYNEQDYPNYNTSNWTTPVGNGQADSARSEAELRKRLREARGGTIAGNGVLSAGAMPYVMLEGNVKLESNGLAKKQFKLDSTSDGIRATSLPSSLPPPTTTSTITTAAATSNGSSLKSKSGAKPSIRENLQLVSKKINALPVEGVESILEILSVIIEDVQQLENRLPQLSTQTSSQPNQVVPQVVADEGLKIDSTLEKISAHLGTGFDELKISLEKILKIVASSSPSAGEKRDTADPGVARRVNGGGERSNTIDMTIDDDEDSQKSKFTRPPTSASGSGSGANGLRSAQGSVGGGGGKVVANAKGTKKMSPDSPLPTGPASNITTYRKPVDQSRGVAAASTGAGQRGGARSEETKPLSNVSTRSSSSSIAVATLLQPSLHPPSTNGSRPILTTVKQYPPPSTSSAARPRSPPPLASSSSSANRPRPISPPPPSSSTTTTTTNRPTQASLFRPPRESTTYPSTTPRFGPVRPSHPNARRPISPPPPSSSSIISRRNSRDFEPPPPLPAGRLTGSLGSRNGDRDRGRERERARTPRAMSMEGYEDFYARERGRSPGRLHPLMGGREEYGYDYRPLGGGGGGGGGRERERDEWEREREMDRERDLRDLRERERETGLRERERGYGGPAAGPGASGVGGGAGGNGGAKGGERRGFLGPRGGGGQYRVV